MTHAVGQPDERVPDERVTIRVNQSEAVVLGSGTLLSAIRDDLGLTGAKLGCGEGACGACTVLVDGEPVRSCQRTAASAAGQDITTIEGLANGTPGAAAATRPVGLHPVQRAFAEEGAAQCGFCTPGMILVTVGLLSAEPNPDDAAIEAALSGQICRCGSYQRIRRAVRRAAGAAATAGAGLSSIAGPESTVGTVSAPSPESAADHSAADHSAADHSAADHSAADHSAADHSAADHSAADPDRALAT
ncbi:MAG: (2Fe-2S)-binding protein, partial [Streptosporangiaceae bacterium]